MLKLDEIFLKQKSEKNYFDDRWKEITKATSIHRICKQGVDYLDQWKLNNHNYRLFANELHNQLFLIFWPRVSEQEKELIKWLPIKILYRSQK